MNAPNWDTLGYFYSVIGEKPYAYLIIVSDIRAMVVRCDCEFSPVVLASDFIQFA